MKKLIVILLLFNNTAQAQTLEALIERVSQIHPSVKGTEAEQKQYESLKRAAFELPKTEIQLTYGQYNSIINHDNNITVTQTIPFPTVWRHQQQVYKAEGRASELKTTVIKNDIIYHIKQLYTQALYQNAYHTLLLKQDSLYSALVKAVGLRYNVGEGTLLEKTAIETQYHEIKNLLNQSQADRENINKQLQLFLQTDDSIAITGQLVRLPYPDIRGNTLIAENPLLQYKKQQSIIALQEKKLESNRSLPNITIGYFNQTLIGYQNINGSEQYFGKNRRFDGFIAGLAVPLWYPSFTAKVKAAEYKRQAREFEEEALEQVLQRKQAEVLNQLEQKRNTVLYYEDSALPNAALLEQQSSIAFQNGEIDYSTLLLNQRQALSIRQNHLKAIYDYNHSIIQLEHLNSTSDL